MLQGLNSDDGRPARQDADAGTPHKGKGKEKDVREKSTDKKSIDRREFLQALVRLAVMKYVKSGKIADVSTAVRMLVTENLIGHAPAGALSDNNEFRRALCYKEENDNVLQANAAQLRSLYACYAKLNGADLKGYSSNQTIELPEWLQLLEDREFFEVDGKGIKFSQAVIIFLRSRMRCRDDGLSFKDKTLGKMALASRSLNFPDFCEALVRVAVVAEALPDAAGDYADWPPAGADDQWLVRRLTSLVRFVLSDL